MALIDLRDQTEEEDQTIDIDQPLLGDCMGQMKNEEQTQIQDNNPAQCIRHCRERGFKFAGVQGQRCRCVNERLNGRTPFEHNGIMIVFIGAQTKNPRENSRTTLFAMNFALEVETKNTAVVATDIGIFSLLKVHRFSIIIL